MSRYTNTTPAIYDINGKPVVGAKKFFFKPGSTILKTIYKDVDFIIPQENPVLSDANGRFPDMFLDGIYKEVQQDNSGTPSGFDGVTLWTKDSVGTAPIKGEFQEWNPAITYIITSIVVGSNGNYYKSKIDPNFNNDPISSPLAWTQLKFGEIWNSTTSYFIGDSAYGVDGFAYTVIIDNVGKEPSVSSEWIPSARLMQSAIAGGTADDITASFLPKITALQDGLEVRVRALGMNTLTNPSFSPDSLPSKTVTKNGNNVLEVGDIFGAGTELILKYNSSNDVWELLNPSTPSNVVLGMSYTSNSTPTSTTSQIPFDNTIPQITEGGLILTRIYSQTKLNSRFFIEINCNISGSTGTGTDLTIALFDGGVNAVAANTVTMDAAGISPISLLYEELYPGKNTITFTLRFGKGVSGTSYVNSESGSNRLGGSLNCSMKITEVT